MTATGVRSVHATEALERFVHMLERIIERGIASGELRPVDARDDDRDVDPDARSNRTGEGAEGAH